MIGWSKILDQVSKVQIKSITDPLFRYSAIVYGFGTITAIFRTDSWVTVVLFLLGSLLLFVGLVFFIYFCINEPDYLRSENFQLKKQSIELLGDRDNTMNPNIKELKFIASPYTEQLELNSNNDFGSK